MNINEIRRRLEQEAMQQRMAEQQQGSYEKLSAAELYCPTCKRSMPVREKPLLYIGTGQLYDYLCVKCGSSLGTRRD